MNVLGQLLKMGESGGRGREGGRERGRTQRGREGERERVSRESVVISVRVVCPSQGRWLAVSQHDDTLRDLKAMRYTAEQCSA